MFGCALNRQLPVILTRLVHIGPTLRTNKYPLPWPHLPKQFQNDDPAWNRLAGIHLIKKVVSNVTGVVFKTTDFLDGVKDAILHFAEAIKSSNNNELKETLHPDLYDVITASLNSIPLNSHTHLDIESIQNLRLTAANSIVGTADQGDEHTISWLGQKIITSQSKMETLLSSERSKFTIEIAREIGKEAGLSRMEFILSVAFSTKEKYAILDEDGGVIEGSNQFIKSHHLWKFGSHVYWDDEYPLEWQIYDINNYLHNQSFDE